MKIISLGCVFVEGAPFLLKEGHVNKYNWENKKISFQLNTNDIDYVLHNIVRGGKLVRQSKLFIFEKVDNKLKFTLQDISKNVLVNITLDEYQIIGLVILLSTAKHKIYGW